MEEKKREEVRTVEEFQKIIEQLRSPGGCPWDREQTHESLKDCIREEAYEVIDGISIQTETGDASNLQEELGDMLLQVVMHCVIAKEQGEFTLEDVVEGIAKKMIRRHPHVFGTGEGRAAKNSAEVSASWEEIKKEERQDTTLEGELSHVTRALPALLRAEKVQKKAAKYGWEFSGVEEVEAKVEEELKEVREAVNQGSLEGIKEETGDLLFSCVNLCRILGENAENSLTKATDKFINRVSSVERDVTQSGRRMDTLTASELNQFWEQKKKRTNRRNET